MTAYDVTGIHCGLDWFLSWPGLLSIAASVAVVAIWAAVEWRKEATDGR